MNPVRFHAEARAELLHEVGYYAAVSRSLGERFDKAVKAAIERAVEFPDMGSPYLHGTRRVIPGKFHFSIVYLKLDEEIVIVAIAPDSREPGYRRVRVDDV